jgi:hypothetical protein
MQLRIAEQYIEEFGRLAKTGNTFVVPANLSDIASMIALATGITQKSALTPLYVKTLLQAAWMIS